MYAESFVTNIDLKFRAKLKGDLSKAFYRFFQGQYENDYSITLLNLANAVNLDIYQDLGKLRKKIRTGLRELEIKEYLQSFEITKENKVMINKCPHVGITINNQILNIREIPKPSEIE